ncbi:hypothetical protein D3C71_1995510 [compost metagenome]
MVLRIAGDEMGVGQALGLGATAGGGDQGPRDIQSGASPLGRQSSGGGQGRRACTAADIKDVAGAAGCDGFRQKAFKRQEQAVQQLLLLDPDLAAA